MNAGASLTAMVTQFVMRQQHHGISLWMHLPASAQQCGEDVIEEFNARLTQATDRINGAQSSDPADASIHAMQAVLMIMMDLVLAAGQSAMAAKGPQTCWDTNVHTKAAQHSLAPRYLSSMELLLCCILVVHSTATVFAPRLTTIPLLGKTLAEVYSTLMSQPLSCTADKTAGSASCQLVSTDLSTAVVQQTTLRLRNSATSCAATVDCCIEVLLFLARLDHTPESIISNFIKQGEQGSSKYQMPIMVELHYSSSYCTDIHK